MARVFVCGIGRRPLAVTVRSLAPLPRKISAKPEFNPLTVPPMAAPSEPSAQATHVVAHVATRSNRTALDVFMTV